MSVISISGIDCTIQSIEIFQKNDIDVACWMLHSGYSDSDFMVIQGQFATSN